MAPAPSLACQRQVSPHGGWRSPTRSQSAGRSRPQPALAWRPCPAWSSRPRVPFFGRDEAAIEEGPVPLKILPLVQQRQQTTPDLFTGAVLLPRLEPPPARGRSTVFTGHVFPAAPGA